MQEKSKKRLGEILVEDGTLSKESLEEALVHQKKEGGMIGQVLVKLGYLTEENLLAALGRQLGIPYLPLANYSVNLQAVQNLKEDFCRSHMMLLFDQDEKHAFVALSDPFDEMGFAELEKQVTQRPQIFLASPTDIMHMIDMAFSQSRNNQNQTRKAG